MKLIQLHYHEHAKVCPKCAVARDLLDTDNVLAGDKREVESLYNNSCEFGQEILKQFWMSYKDDGN
jgi:hypothetical protein